MASVSVVATVPEPGFLKYAPAETQSFVVAADVEPPAVVRDEYGATARPLPTPGVYQWAGGAAPVASRNGPAIVAYAKQFVGKVPYGSGNHPGSSFSCDGLVQYVFAQFGLALPRGANSQAAYGVVIPRALAQAGDLVWYPGQHVGIYAGGGMMVDSPRPGKFVEYRQVWGSPLYVRIP